MKSKTTKDTQINIKVTAWQHRILTLMGGPTEVLERAIERELGEKEKLKQARRQALLNIEQEEKRITEIDKLIREFDEKVAEELKQKQEAKQKQILKEPHPKLSPKKKAADMEQTRIRWKGYLQSGEWSELSENNYNIIMRDMGFRTKEEVDAWLRGE